MRGFVVALGVGEGFVGVVDGAGGFGVGVVGVVDGVGAVAEVGVAVSDGVGAGDGIDDATADGVVLGIVGGVLLSAWVGVAVVSAAEVQETSNDPQPASSTTAAVRAAAVVAARVLLLRPIRPPPSRPLVAPTGLPEDWTRLGVRHSTRRS